MDGLDFSFSGLKTAFLNFLTSEKKKNEDFLKASISDVCASLQDRIVSILLNKLKKAANLHGVKHLAIAGGVSANSGLRRAFEAMCNENQWTSHISGV